MEREHERMLTRNGRAAAVLISPEDLAQLEETIDVLRDPEALADIREADGAYRTGDVLRGVAAAAAELLTGALVAAPQRVGKSLRFELAGVWAAGRGTYRVLYRINEQAREVVVLRVEHRRDAYRPL